MLGLMPAGGLGVRTGSRSCALFGGRDRRDPPHLYGERLIGKAVQDSLTVQARSKQGDIAFGNIGIDNNAVHIRKR